MKFKLLFCSLLISFSVFGQTKNIKVYSNFTYLNSERYRINNLLPSENSFKFQHFSVAYRKTKEKTFFETEIGLAIFQEEDDRIELNHFDTHIRMELGFKVRESENNKFKLYISPALKAYYLTEETNPLVTSSSSFPIRRELAGLNAAVFIRGEYHFSELFYLDVNTTFLGGSFGVDFQNFEDPSLTARQQRQGGFDMDFFFERLLRIGIGYKFQ